MEKRDKVYKLETSNRITYENLERIDESVFENVYKEADRTLAKIMDEACQYQRNKEKDEQSLNVISFLGGRGRGKTSAMLSFIYNLRNLKNYDGWSEVGKKHPNAQYIILPYIDAAMLAEQEFIIDVILAEMWDRFEEELENYPPMSRETSCRDDLRRSIKKLFAEVRRAYCVSQERETKASTSEELPTAGILHELAVSINLRQQMAKLVEEYLCFFGKQDRYCYEENDRTKKEIYLIIPIDDIDMSGKKAHYILEQIRRFLRIPNVIVMLTADIDRLQKACELRFADICKDERDRQRVISEYLEKVVPYNMRVYLPELKENHGKILIQTQARERLQINSENEKDFILEVMLSKCGLYFDGTRKKRHFLQNQTMRSMVNYFEQLIRVDGIDDYSSWLKTDIKERLVERISDLGQKAFMEELLTKDYEDINSLILGYINKNLKDKKLEVDDKGLGEVLYACNLLETENAQNIDFVNCIIMLYSVIMKKADKELKEKIWGNSIFGEWEYNAVQDTASELCQGFSSKAQITFRCRKELLDKIKTDGLLFVLSRVLMENIVNLKAWIYMLLFVDVILNKERRITYEISSVFKQEIEGENGTYYIEMKPKVLARKNFLGCGYMNNHFNNMKSMLIVCINALADELDRLSDERMETSRSRKHKFTKVVNEFLKEMGITNLKDEDQDEKFSHIFCPQAIEIFYSMGRSVNQITHPDTYEEEDLYNTLVLKYKTIYEKLEEIDEYYHNIGITSVDYAQTFRNTYQSKLLFGDIGLEEIERREFERRMGELLMEAKRAVILTSPSR